VLRSLYVRDYALIEELEVDFASGLNVITGETGAGKSILIGALKMILGERASTEVVREGARKAVIEGVFDEADTPRLRKVLEENAIDVLPQMIVRREITAAASRAFINDSPATVTLLRQVAGNLIDLHGQHDNQSLLRTELHLPLLDDFGGLGGMVETYRKQYASVSALVKERAALQARERDLASLKERYEFEIEEIDAVGPKPDEEDQLNAQRRVLENAERLYEATANLYEMLFEADRAVHDQLVVARNELQDLARIDGAFDESLAEVRSAQIVVAETATFLQDYNARIEFNPEGLEEIRDRLGQLDALKRRYGGTLEAVLAHREDIGVQYDIAADFAGAIQRLDGKIAQAQTRLSRAAQRLSAKRREVAARIEHAIVAELDGLGMPNSQFEVRFENEQKPDGWVLLEGDERTRYAAHADGMDRVQFFISTNLGERPKPLARVASGGEVSRIMLALKTILAKSDRLPILVFDEIDTGISGPIAYKVGRSMHDLADYHQIIVITHHAQIAALGDAHYVVEKRIAGERTRTQMRRLEGDERADAVATLISGSTVTDAALESARELMAAGERP
jgi:DNA repair protein RecN (Recombination protein N)